MPSSRSILSTGGLLLAAAMTLGAFGAHGLAAHVTADRIPVYDTALRYHFWNALGLLAIGITARFSDSRLLAASAWLVIAGILLFSGSLYLLTFGAPRAIGLLTPVGGVALIGGWIVYAVAARRA